MHPEQGIGLVNETRDETRQDETRSVVVVVYIVILISQLSLEQLGQAFPCLQCRSVIVDIPVVKNPNSKLGFKLKSYYKNSIWSIILQVFEILASGQFFLEKKVSFFGRC